MWFNLFCLEFGVQAFEFRVWGSGFLLSSFRFRGSGFGCRASGFGFQVSGFGARESAFFLLSQTLRSVPVGMQVESARLHTVARPRR